MIYSSKRPEVKHLYPSIHLWGSAHADVSTCTLFCCMQTPPSSRTTQPTETQPCAHVCACTPPTHQSMGVHARACTPRHQHAPPCNGRTHTGAPQCVHTRYLSTNTSAHTCLTTWGWLSPTFMASLCLHTACILRSTGTCPCGIRIIAHRINISKPWQFPLHAHTQGPHQMDGHEEGNLAHSLQTSS